MTDPAIACTLTSPELRARQAETAALARRSLRSREPGLLVFDLEAEAALREVIAAEASCCPFLSFDLRRTADALELRIDGPDEAAPIIAGLFA